MATTRKKKTTTTKATTKPVAVATEEVVSEAVDETPVSEAVEEEPVKKVAKPKVADKKTYSADDGIPCTSICVGELLLIGEKTGNKYDWVEQGDTVEVEYQDLVAWVRMNASCIKNPYFVVEDEDFLALYPNVKEVYGTMYSYRDLRKVISDLDAMSMKLTIQSLPKGAQDSIKAIASSMIRDGQLDSVSKIKMLDEIYGTDFMLLSGLYKE